MCAVFMHSDRVLLKTTLTIVLRALPLAPEDRGIACRECIEVARATLMIHKEAAEKFTAPDESVKRPKGGLFSDYLHW
jgi:hypothetical protein